MRLMDFISDLTDHTLDKPTHLDIVFNNKNPHILRSRRNVSAMNSILSGRRRAAIGRLTGLLYVELRIFWMKRVEKAGTSVLLDLVGMLQCVTHERVTSVQTEFLRDGRPV